MLVLKRSRDSAVRCRRCHTIIFRRTLYPSRVTRDSAPVDLSLQLVKDALTFNGRRRQGFGCDELRNAFIRLLPAIRSLERRARYLFYCMFVCLFVRSTSSRQPAGRFTPKFACGRTLVPDVSSPLLGVGGPRRAEKGANEIFVTMGVSGEFLHFGGF